jgi:hypothetical protein
VHPFIENLTDVVSLSVNVGAKVDLDQLVDEVTEIMAGRSHVLEQRYRQYAWGAAGSGVELILEVPTAAASAMLVWNQVAGRFRQKRQVRPPQAGDTAKSAAAWAATCLRVPVESVRIVGLEPAGDGHRVLLETPEGSFIVETDAESGVSRLTRNESHGSADS